MKTLHTIITDLRKSVLSIGFLACIAVTTVLCFTTSAYTDNNTNISYSVFDALLYLDWYTLAKENVSSLTLIKNSLLGYSVLFMPIISALAFVTAFCSERNTGAIRFNITRTGKYRYYISKFVSATISAGLAVTIGCAVFSVVVYFTFPNSADCFQYSVYGFTDTELPTIKATLFHTLVGAFIFGAVSVLPAFFLTSFVKNRYIITCVPFVFAYIQTVALNKIMMSSWTDENGQEIMQKCMIFEPTTVTSWYTGEDYVKYSLIYNGICAAAAFVGFAVIMNCRFDKGE